MRSDPIGLSGGFNRYLYATQNPISTIDPSGLMGVIQVYQAKQTYDHILVIYDSYEQAYEVVSERLRELEKIQEQLYLNIIDGKVTDVCAQNYLERYLQEEIRKTRLELIYLCQKTGRSFNNSLIAPLPEVRK